MTLGVPPRLAPALLAAAFLLAATAASAAVKLKGTVLNAKDEPVGLATVVVTEIGGSEFTSPYRTQTDNKGRFAAEMPGEGSSWRVAITKKGYVPATRTLRAEEISEGKAASKLRFTLDYRGLNGWRDGWDTSKRTWTQACLTAYNQGHRIYEAGDVETARPFFERALEVEPEFPPANAALAPLYLAGGDFGKALVAAEIVLRSQPRDLAALRIRFESLLALGDQEQADAALEAIREADSGVGTAVLLHNEGVKAFKAGNPARAMPSFRAAVEVDPELTASWSGLAKSAMLAGEHGQALKAAAKVLELQPGDAVALGIRHDAFDARGEHAEAEALLDELGRRDPSPETARRLYNAGVRAFERRSLEAARGRFEQALEADAELGLALKALATACLELGDPGAALEAAERLLALDPEDSAGLRLRERAAARLARP